MTQQPSVVWKRLGFFNTQTFTNALFVRVKHGSRGNLVVSEVISGASVRRRGLTRWLPIDLRAFVITSLQRNSLSHLGSKQGGCGGLLVATSPAELWFVNVPLSQD